MKTIFIVGVGLIGGSIAKIIKQGHPKFKIIANDVDQTSLNYLNQHQIIDESVTFEQGAEQSDIIILAMPINGIIKHIQKLTHLTLKSNALVTDVGSSKRLIMKTARPLMKQGIQFLGGHPMAGSHLTGGINSKVDLFQHHTYFLVNGNASLGQIENFKELFNSTRVSFKSLNVNEHDQVVSIISHLPHAIAFSLINMIEPELTDLNVSDQIAAGGLLDTTRIAMSDPNVWTSIMKSNSDLLVGQINHFEDELDKLKVNIKQHDTRKIQSKIKEANKSRIHMERDD